MDSKKLFGLFFLMVLLVGTVSAWDGDNTYRYNEETKTATIENLWGAGSDIGVAQLIWGDTQVGIGVDTHVGTYGFIPYINLSGDSFIDAELINKRTGTNFNNRNMNYKVKRIEYVSTPFYNITCVQNATGYDICTEEFYANIDVPRYEWVDIKNPNFNFIENNYYEIGIFVDTEEGDYGDWIPNFMGIQIEEWATWNSSLETGARQYNSVNETSGTVLEDHTGQGRNFTLTNSPTWYDAGNIGYALDFDGTTEYGATANYVFTETDVTFNIWVNTTDTAGQLIGAQTAGVFDGFQVWLGVIGTNGYAGCRFGTGATPWQQVLTTGAINDGNWHMVTCRRSGTNLTVWIDGQLNNSATVSGSSIANPNKPIYLGVAQGNSNFLDGSLTKIGFWNRSISDAEIVILENSGRGCLWGDCANGDVSPVVTLYSPVDEFNSTTQTNYLVWNATDSINLTNWSLIVDDVYVFTNSTPFNATPQNYSYDFGEDGTYAWKVEACDNASQCTNSSARNINIDTTFPTITLFDPSNNSYWQNTTNNNVTVSLNLNATDANLDTCWYNFNGVNTTIPSCANTTIQFNSSTNGTITLYVNDTFGFENNSVSNFFVVNEFTETLGYSATTIEEENQTITLTLTDYNTLTNLEGNLTWNGTVYTATVTDNVLSYTLTNPAVDSNTAINFSFTYLINNESFTTANTTQTILNFTAFTVGVSCGAGLSEAMHFTFSTENNLTAHNASADYLFRYGITNTSARVTKGNLTNVAGFYLCINSTLYNNYTLSYGEVQYEKTGFTDRRFYNFEGEKVSNVTQNYTLYSLNNADSTSFLMTAQGSDLSPYEGYLLGLSRWYPELDQYNSVELARTDEKGQTVLKVYTEDVDYRISVYFTNGTLLYISDPFRLTCTVNPCSYTITVSDDTGQLFERWQGLNDSLTFNTTTGVFTFVYNDPSQTTDNITLKVYKMTGTGNVEICSDFASGYTSILYCNVSGYTGQLQAIGYRSASPSTAIASLIQSIYATALTNDMGLIVTLGIMVVLILVGTVSPILTVILSIVGLIPAIVLGIIPLQVMLIFGAIGFIVVAYMRKT